MGACLPAAEEANLWLLGRALGREGHPLPIVTALGEVNLSGEAQRAKPGASACPPRSLGQGPWGTKSSN